MVITLTITDAAITASSVRKDFNGNTLTVTTANFAALVENIRKAAVQDFLGVDNNANANVVVALSSVS